MDLGEARDHARAPVASRAALLLIYYPTLRVRGFIEEGLRKRSAPCHVFRHTMATLMLERGADVRLIEEILGHEELSTTEIYTRVSIGHLESVHDRTHPGAKLARAPRVPESDATTDDEGYSANTGKSDSEVKTRST